MRTASTVLSLAALALLLGGSSALHAAPAVPAPPADAATIKTLIQQLGDQDFQTRENAEKKLKELGAVAADALTQAMDSTDAEIKDRATRLVQAIRREAVRTDAAWQCNLDNALTAPLTLGNGTVFAAIGPTLIAIDAKTGKIQWKAAPNSGNRNRPLISTAPVVVDKVVCVAVNNSLYAYDVKSGKLAWSKAQLATALGLPTGGKGLVVVAGPDKLYAVDTATGKLTWQTAIASGIVGAPLVTDGFIYVVTNDAHLVALDTSAKEPKEAWSIDIGNSATTGPTAGPDGTLYLGAAQDLLAFDTQKKTRKWSCAITGNADEGMVQPMIPLAPAMPIAPGQPQQGYVNPGVRAPVIDRGVAYYAVGGCLNAVDAATGQSKWTFAPQLPEGTQQTEENPGVNLGGAGFQLRMRVAVDPSMAAGALTDSPPLIVGKTAYLSTSSGLFAIEVKTGLQLWRFPTTAPAIGTPLLANDCVLFATGIGGVGPQILLPMMQNGMLPAPQRPGAPGNPRGPTYVVFALPVQCSNPAIPAAK